jgi:streptogramin lyase
MKSLAKVVLGIVGVSALLFAVAYIVTNSGGPGSECLWYRSVSAWIDLNEDGIHDPDEPPLDGVAIQIDDPEGWLSDESKTVTDFNGRGDVSMVQCGGREDIIAHTPDGYELTTRSPIKASDEQDDGEPPLEFGFAPLPGTDLPGEYVPALTCEQIPFNVVDDLVATPEGVWVVSFDLNLIDAETQRTIRSIELAQMLTSPRWIIPTANGMYVDSHIHWGYYDGTDWTVWELNRGETFSEITTAVHELQDGRLWFTASNFFALYDPETDRLEVQTREGMFGSSITRFVVLKYNDDWFIARLAEQADVTALFDPAWVVVSDQTLTDTHIDDFPGNRETLYFYTDVGPDGAVWMASSEEFVRYSPAHDSWTGYRLEDVERRATFDFIEGIAIHPDGSIWLSNERSVLRMIPASETVDVEWQQFDARDGFDDGTAGHIAIDEHGTIWLGSSRYGTILNRCRLAEDQE